MKTIDWILAILFTALVSFAFDLLLPTYQFSWLVGAILAGFLLFRAKKRRDQMLSELQNKKANDSQEQS